MSHFDKLFESFTSTADQNIIIVELENGIVGFDLSKTIIEEGIFDSFFGKSTVVTKVKDLLQKAKQMPDGSKERLKIKMEVEKLMNSIPISDRKKLIASFLNSEFLKKNPELATSVIQKNPNYHVVDKSDEEYR